MFIITIVVNNNYQTNSSLILITLLSHTWPSCFARRNILTPTVSFPFGESFCVLRLLLLVHFHSFNTQSPTFDSSTSTTRMDEQKSSYASSVPPIDQRNGESLQTQVGRAIYRSISNPMLVDLGMIIKLHRPLAV